MAGLVTMLNSVVPTCANAAVWVSRSASTANTSVSGSRNRIAWSQVRCSSSSQCPVAGLSLTISATCGAGLPSKFVAGPGLPPGDTEPLALVHGVLGWKPSQTSGSITTEVWLPVLNPATYTVLRSGLTASARGVSVKKLMILTGVPPSVPPSCAGSNTQTSARGTDGVVSCGSPAPATPASDGSVRCWPRCAVVMNARFDAPAKTMSRGSSPTSRVRATCGVPVRVTTLTLSERWFTTQTSLALRAATATGSRPTGTRAENASPPSVTLKISSVPLGVLTANTRLPSGDIAIGRTWPLSNSRNGGDVTAAGGAWRSIGLPD